LVAAVLAVPVLAAAATLPAQAASHRPVPVAAQIDRFLRVQLRDSAIPGAAVAVTHGDQVLMVRGYGHDSTGEAVTGDSLFRVASLSKSFTALAVMQLVDAGLLQLDDPVRQHLPEFEMADPRADQVTVRDLLNHTSGITDTVVPDLSRPQPSSPREATTSLRSAHLASTPGTSYSYANPNYQVAARLVEVLSGEPFGRYLRRHVLQPARMSATTSTVTDDQPVPGLAEGHLIAYGHAFAAPGFGSYTAGDGGVVSTAAEMARWLIVNANDGRAPERHPARLRSRHAAAPHPELSSKPLRPRMGRPRPGRRPNPRGAQRQPVHLHLRGGALAGVGIRVVLLFNAGSPMMLDQIAIVHGVFDIVEGTTPPARGPHSAVRLDTVLSLLTLVALTLGIGGVVRAGRWAGRWARRRRSARLLAALGLLPSVVVIVAGAAFPRLAEVWIGRNVTWRAAAYEWPALAVFVCAALIAAAGTLSARSWRWWGVQRPSQPDHARGDATTAPSGVVSPAS